jgi:carnosine N-methyltransferase
MENDDNGLNNVANNRELTSLSSSTHPDPSPNYVCHSGPTAHGRKQNDSDSRDNEKEHFENVCSAYRLYAKFAMAHWANHAYRFQSLPESQRKVLPPHLLMNGPSNSAYVQSVTRYKEAVIRNQFCLDCILKHTGQPHSQQQGTIDDVALVSDEQISKLSSVLKSLARDWSEGGRMERDMAYQPIIAHIQKYLPAINPQEDARMNRNPNPPQVCVPGSGLGRLAFDLIRLGYTVQGNDFSLYMLLASDFILNSGVFTPDRPMHISPWLFESRNVHSRHDILETVQVPDVDPYEAILSSVPQSGQEEPNFSVAAGDFCSIYGNPKETGQWDAVASCFFLDACPSIVETLQVVHHMLKPGGLLVNLGPLLYHWTGPVLRPDDEALDDYRNRYAHLDERYLTSVELTYDDVKVVMNNIGFDVVEEHIGIECYYTAHHRSMMTTMYKCVSFVAKKRQ